MVDIVWPTDTTMPLVTQASITWKRRFSDGPEAEPYMQKTCVVAEKAILAKKKIAEKVRKSRQNVNRDKSA